MGGLGLSAVGFRRIAWTEALAYVALVVGAGAEYFADGPAAVAVLGPLHGVVYLAYAAAVWARSRATGWTAQTQVVLLGSGILPLGTIWAERWARTRRRR